MPEYRRLHIKGYNYIFFTIVTQYRIKILIQNIDLLQEAFNNTLKKYKFEIFAIVILKDHIHMILNVTNVEEYPKIIYSLKNYFSRRISQNIVEINQNKLSTSKIKRKEKGIWQRRYYDHIIRNEDDLYKHIDYIHFNSMKHYNVLPKDWKYSSFKKFVELEYYDENWCNTGDKNQILQMDFE